MGSFKVAKPFNEEERNFSQKKKKKKKEISTSEVCHSVKVEFFAKIFALSRLRLIRLSFFFFFNIVSIFGCLVLKIMVNTKTFLKLRVK